MRTWLALALAACVAAAWAQSPPPAQKKDAKPAARAPKAQKAQKAQKAHRKATPEQIRRFKELEKTQDPKR